MLKAVSESLSPIPPDPKQGWKVYFQWFTDLTKLVNDGVTAKKVLDFVNLSSDLKLLHERLPVAIDDLGTRIEQASKSPSYEFAVDMNNELEQGNVQCRKDLFLPLISSYNSLINNIITRNLFPQMSEKAKKLFENVSKKLWERVGLIQKEENSHELAVVSRRISLVVHAMQLNKSFKD